MLLHIERALPGKEFIIEKLPAAIFISLRERGERFIVGALLLLKTGERESCSRRDDDDDDDDVWPENWKIRR